MKNYIFPILVLLVLLGIGCKKDNQDNVTGITATKDGSNWTASNFGTGFKPLATKDTLFIRADNNEEHLIIALKQKGEGIYQPIDITRFYITLGLDVLVSTYELDNTANNLVTLTTYNEGTHQLKGTFALTFKNTMTNNGYPDKIVLGSGKINISLTDVYMNPYIPK